jgi:hypothetical protein
MACIGIIQILFGRIIFKNKDIFISKFNNFYYRQFGLIYSNGDKYEGFWQKDMANGYGRFILADGDVFEGNWVDDKAHGLGNYFYAEGATYKG